MSHPAWVRGLKQNIAGMLEYGAKSHPAWVRGLKLVRHNSMIKGYYVAPCVGAWIETYFQHILTMYQ